MLILSRKKNQRVAIGPNIEVVVLGVEGKQVKLDLQAPREVPIRRAEIPLRRESLPESATSSLRCTHANDTNACRFLFPDG